MKPLRRLLVANRGEIARRVMRTAHAMGIETVAVYSDADAGALHVREATTAYPLGGHASADSYLRIDKLLAAAHAAGADAVHPGYGFLSENADFAQAVVDAGLNWVGPPPEAMRVLGSKASVKQLALARGVPCLPGYFGVDQSDATLAREAARIGWPVMVKADAGGGGRGMRLALQAEQLAAAVHSARSEAISSFGSGKLVLERALLAPRHVEIQIFADSLGHCVHLGERDCSVQRRHQKIIEESPSPAVDAARREAMGRCAVALAQSAGYVGAGTIEFLLDGDAFYLMEMNTRLQVEHPVTEAVTGLDLVEWQLRVARGEALPRTQEQVRFQGHAIEVRLCAEDETFTPHAGTVQRFEPPDLARGLRFDHALAEGTVVTPHYDSMLGKLIAHGDTRDDAIAGLIAALAQMRVLGFPTNRGLLMACLDHPVFRAGHAQIPFLAEQGEALRQTLLDAEREALLPATLAMHYAAAAGPAANLPAPFDRPLRVRHRDAAIDMTLRETGGGRVDIVRAGVRHAATCMPCSEHRGLQAVVLDGVRHLVDAVAVSGRGWHVQVGGVDSWLQDTSHAASTITDARGMASELRAPFNGRVVAVHVVTGSRVARGEALLVIESMKLEHAVSAPRDVEVAAVEVQVGQQVAPGQLLVRFAA